MSERQESGRPQRYCTNCGAQIRPGNAFCVSCGTALTPGTGQTGPHDPGPEPSGGSASRDEGLPGRKGIRFAPYVVGAFFFVVACWLLGFLTLGVLLVGVLSLLSPVLGRAGGSRPELERQPSESGMGAPSSGDSKRAFRWVLAAAFVLALFGQLLQTDEGMGRSLVPLAALAFVVCLIVVVVGRSRGESVRGWRIAAAASLGLTLVLWGVPGRSDVPTYEMIDSQQVPDPSGYSHTIAYVFSDSVSRANLEGIAEDIAPRFQGHDSAMVMVWDEDRASYNPGMPFPMRVSTAQGGFSPPAATITLALTSAGAAGWEVPEDEYRIKRNR